MIEVMKLTAIMMCKNEEDIIERFIRINSQVVDRFVIYDDSSSDRTVEIIKKVISENRIRVTLIQDTEETKGDNQLRYHQNNIMNYLMKFALESDPECCDFILPMDADEFIFEDRVTVCKELFRISDYGTSAYGALAWKTFAPLRSYSHWTPLRSAFEPLLKEKVVIYKAAVPRHLIETQQLWMGNHILIGNSNQVVLDIPLCHFPVRSVNQIIAKALITDHKFSMKRNRLPTEGYHISKVAQLIRENDYNLSQKDLIDITLNYLRKDNYPQRHEFGTYHKFLEFDEEPLCYSFESDHSFLTRALDTFMMDVVKAVP